MEFYKKNNRIVIVLPPDLTDELSAELSKLCVDHIKKGENKFLIDATSLKFINSYGVGALLRVLIKLKNAGGEMRIKNLSGQPFNIFASSGLVAIFTIQEEETVHYAEEEFLGIETSRMVELEVTQEKRDDVVVFHLSGSLCVSDGIRIFKDKAELAMADCNKFVLDCEDLDYIDSLAIGAIVNINTVLKTSGGGIRICKANKLVNDTIKGMNLQGIFPNYEKISDALKNWGSR